MVFPETVEQQDLTVEAGATFEAAFNEAAIQCGIKSLAVDNIQPALQEAADQVEEQDEEQDELGMSLAAVLYAYTPQPIIVEDNSLNNYPTDTLKADGQACASSGVKSELGQVLQGMAKQTKPETEGIPENKATQTVDKGLEGMPMQDANPNIAQVPEASVNKNDTQNQDQQKHEDTLGSGLMNKAASKNDNVDPPDVHASSSVKKEGQEKNIPEEMPSHAAVPARHFEIIQEVQATDESVGQTVENPAVQVAKASVASLKRGEMEYRVKLSPEGLGNVEVTVVAKGSELSMSMRTDNEAAQSLILGHADELRAELSAQNYQVSSLSVGVDLGGQSNSGFYSFSDQSNNTNTQGRLYREDAVVSGPELHVSTMQRQPAPRHSTINYRV